jgi:hypothetical protein
VSCEPLACGGLLSPPFRKTRHLQHRVCKASVEVQIQTPVDRRDRRRPVEALFERPPIACLDNAAFKNPQIGPCPVLKMISFTQSERPMRRARFAQGIRSPFPVEGMDTRLTHAEDPSLAALSSHLGCASVTASDKTEAGRTLLACLRLLLHRLRLSLSHCNLSMAFSCRPPLRACSF